MIKRPCVRLLLTLLACGTWAAGYTQDSLHVKKLHYTGMFSMGALVGDSEEALTVSMLTAHGVVLNRVRMLGGLGIEGFEGRRVVPFFLGVSYDLAREKNGALFVQMNGGYARVKRLQPDYFVDANVEERGGVMINPLLGYRASIERRYSLYVAVGHRYQRAEYLYEYPGIYRRTRTEEFNRFNFVIGLGLH